MNDMLVPDHLRMISELEVDSSLFEPDQMRKRLEVLDELDAYFAESGPEPFIEDLDRLAIYDRAKAIRSRLEAVNSAIYQSIRSDVRKGSPRHELLRWIQICGGQERIPPSGLKYDHLDELICGVLQLREPELANSRCKPGMVFYQPTPARYILDFIRISGLYKDDVLVDIGSGLGHVPMLAFILTGARSIGIEANPAYVTSARICARALGVGRVRFVQRDATHASLSTGTVFYMYTPFTGTLLKKMLHKLRMESAKRRIKVCTLGPCALVVQKEPWLRASEAADEDRITCFQSNA